MPLPRHIWVPLSNTLIKGRRKPDLVLVAPEAQHREIKWKDVIAICEVKYKDSVDLAKDALLQLGDKANFIFSHQRNRSWLVGIQLCGTIIRLVVFTWGGECLYSGLGHLQEQETALEYPILSCQCTCP